MFHQKLLVDVEPGARPRLLDEGRRFLIAERHAARVRRNGSSGAAEQPIQWPADDLYTFPQTPTTSVAVIPTMSSRSVVLAWWATAPGERPWCDSPQPITPSSARGTMSGTLGRRRCACAASRRVQ